MIGARLGVGQRVALGLALLVTLGVGLAWGALPPGLPAPLLLVLLTVIGWATDALPQHVTALLFFSAATVLSLAAPATVFHGFEQGAFWLVLSGIVLGASVLKTGLGGRLGDLLKRFAGRTYPGTVAVTAIGATALAFIVPAAIPRVVLLLPVTDALASSLGFERGTRGHTGIVLAALLATVVPSFAILTGNLPNLVLLGALQTVHGVEVGYLDYLLWNFPILGLLKLLSIIALAVWWFNDVPAPAEAAPAPERLDGAQRRLLAVLGLTLAFWATDGLHGVAPAWVGLAAATACLLPGVGFLAPKSFSTDLNFASLFYIAGVLGLVSLVAESGIGAWLGDHLLAFAGLDGGAPLLAYMKLLLVSGAIGLLVTHPNIPAILIPAAGQIADATGLSLIGVAMVPVAAFSLLFLPYQTAPMAIGISLAELPYGTAVRFLAVNALVSLVVLAPLQGLWLWWLGVLTPP